MLMRKESSRLAVRAVRATRLYSTKPDTENMTLYLNPHQWQGLPADRIFELHNLRQKALGEKYNPDDAERSAILSTISALGSKRPGLDYAYELDNFKERYMNNTPVLLRDRPPRLSNIPVLERGKTPHEQRKIDQLTRISAYEMPLLAKFRQEYNPHPNNKLKLTFHSDFTDESNIHNRKVTVTCALADLGLNDKQANKFKILSGNKFDHNKQILKFSSNNHPEATQNARWLVETLNKLLNEAKDLSKESFEDIPLDTRHTKPKAPKPQFPESWLRPQDAPLAQHKVVRKLVDNVKSEKDKHFVSEFSP